MPNPPLWVQQARAASSKPPARPCPRSRLSVAASPASAPIDGVVYVGRNGRPLKHPRADWIAEPARFELPPFTTEFRFHPVRRWRFDYAWPSHRVALEVDGASGSYGRHSRPGGMRSDHEKLNTATAMGWRVLRVLAGEETRLSTLQLLQQTLSTTGEQAA